MKLPVYDELRENVAGTERSADGPTNPPNDVAVQRGRILARKVGLRDIWMV